MPNRILREGILTSPRMAKLGWAEEVFYRRLMSVVDDFGRYYADHGLLRAGCYPRQLSKVSDPDIGKWLTALVEAALVRVYPAEDGERYLQLLDFRQQVRAGKSKFPEPRSECAADATQTTSKPPADAPVFVFGDEGVVVGDSARKRAKPPPKLPLPAEFGISAKVRDWAVQHGFGQLDEHLDAFRRKCAAHGYVYQDHDAAFMEAIREDWAKLRGKTANGTPAPGQSWHESRQGIVAKGVELGIGEWTEPDWHAGKMPQWPVYQARVFEAAGYQPPRAS